ncbi:MAG: hypothetical protein U5J62_07355 [Desulfurivibrio sp.]|nr:hypothetical protein [Desulfurivibrio sp.]
MDPNDNYFAKNMELLKEHHPVAWQAVIDYSGEPVGELVPAADGLPNLRWSGEDGREIFLHDPNDTAHELFSYYALVHKKATGVAMFVGMGLGYTPPAMLKDRPGLRHLAVFEPDIGIFIQALRARDLRDLFTDPRVAIAVGPEPDLTAILQPMTMALQLESLYVLKHTPCFKYAPELYRRVHDEVYARANASNMQRPFPGGKDRMDSARYINGASSPVITLPKVGMILKEYQW